MVNVFLTADEQDAGSTLFSLSPGVNTIVLPARSGLLRRTQYLITNNTVGSNMKLNKGINPASATLGQPLTYGQTYIEGDDGGYTCYQGQINIYSDIAGTVNVMETQERRIQ